MIISLQRKRPVIKKAIKNFGKKVIITRPEVNEFKEHIGDIEVCKVDGFYYRGSSIGGRRINVDIPGETYAHKEEKLMVLMDDTSKGIKVNDLTVIDDVRYRFLDLGQSFDLYYDITLERVV